jgi:hypothetical protein
MSAETESLLVIGGFFTVVAVVLSLLVIGIRRAGMRFDTWLLRKIPLRLAGLAFYCWYALFLSMGFTVLVILSEAGLFSLETLVLAGALFLLAVGAILAWHRKSLRKQGIRLFKRQQVEDAAS